MKYKINTPGHWTHNKCQEAALNYNSISDFQKNEATAYNKSLKNNWLNSICSHMNLSHKPNNYWTIEKCQEVALKYLTRTDFRKNDASAYRISISKKWIEKICNHMTYVNNYWNYDKCKEEALKCNSRNDFQKKYRGAYNFSNVNNISNDICSHMIKIGSKEFRCIYAFEFDDNCAYIGLTYNIKIREQEHIKKGPIYKHLQKASNKYKLIQLTDYINKSEAQKLEEYYMNEYKNNNWKLLNTNKKSTLGGSAKFWTYEKCKYEASKYIYKDDFLKNNSSAAASAIKNEWYKDICSHMIAKKRKNSWPEDDIIFLIENYHIGIKCCAKKLNRSYYSVKSQYQVLKNKFK